METNPEVLEGPDLARDVGRLARHYPNVELDIAEALARPQTWQTRRRLRGFGGRMYKLRASSRDMARGKSGGFRIIVYFSTSDRFHVIAVYAKTEREDLPDRELERRVRRMLDFIRRTLDRK